MLIYKTGPVKIKWLLTCPELNKIVFRRPHPGKFSFLPNRDEVKIVREAKLLGVMLTNNFSFDEHDNSILATCSCRFYLLKLLRDGGMPVDKLNDAFCALIVNCL
jgi:hypothetical protein